MPQPLPLFDRAAHLQHRLRFDDPAALFLHDEAILEVQERLQEVNRTFKSVAIITSAPEIWRNAWPDARFFADDDVLDISAQSHDLVIHAMALHWSNDPVGQLIQCRRALRPDGLLLCVLLGGQTLQELRAALSEAEVALTGGLSPRISPMAEIRDLGGLLQRAGLALPVADSFSRTVTYTSAFHLMAELRHMGETNALTQRQKKFAPRHLFADMARIYQRAFPADNGRIRATFEFIFLTGWAPDPSQPKALQPGSASQSLADALGAIEFNDTTKPANDDNNS